MIDKKFKDYILKKAYVKSIKAIRNYKKSPSELSLNELKSNLLRDTGEMIYGYLYERFDDFEVRSFIFELLKNKLCKGKTEATTEELDKAIKLLSFVFTVRTEPEQ